MKRDPNLVHTARHAKEIAFAGKLNFYIFLNKKPFYYYKIFLFLICIFCLIECKGSDQGEVVTW